jgi:hypothetical protein
MLTEVRFAPFFALFFITSLVPLVDKAMSGYRFMWETEHKVSLADAQAVPVEIPHSFPGIAPEVVGGSDAPRRIGY